MELATSFPDNVSARWVSPAEDATNALLDISVLAPKVAGTASVMRLAQKRLSAMSQLVKFDFSKTAGIFL